MDSGIAVGTVRIKLRDRSRYEDLAERYSDLLVRVAYVIAGDAQVARDAAQNTWQIALTKMPERRDDAQERAWLVAVATNETRKLRRRGQRQERAYARIAANSSAREPADEENQAAIDMDVARALDRLRPEDRQLVALAFVAELTSSEIGRILGLSAEGVRTRKARILARLREDLARVS